MTIKDPKTVVVPVDFSDESMAAVDVALEFVNSPADVIVVHVLPSLSPVEVGVAWEMVDDERRIQETTEAMGKQLSDSKYENIRLACHVGDPGHEIADEATREKADLIVMPSHGRRGIKRLLLGSVAERVLRLAPCAVLVLKSTSEG